MTTSVTVQLTGDQFERLERVARRHGQTAPEAAALLLEESLRQREFPRIQIRDTIVGSQAYIAGTRLSVWMTVIIARAYVGDVAAVAEHLNVPRFDIEAALAYAAAFPDEIEAAIADNDRSVDELRELIPNLEVIEIKLSDAE